MMCHFSAPTEWARGIVALVFAAMACGAAANAQLLQSTPPVRTVSTSIATDSGVFHSITSVRPLSDGRAMVHDFMRRRVVLMEADLRRFRVVADSAPGAPTRYGQNLGALFAFPGDSSVFLDADAQALVVFGPEGNVGRTFALPKASDLRNVTNSPGIAGFDPRGRLVYRGFKPIPRISSPSISQTEDNARTVAAPSYADSAPIVRADFETRTVDTIARMRLPTQKIVAFSNGGRGSCMIQALNPLPTTDAWALLPDGAVAIVRGVDYHIDWWDAAGVKTSTPRMPFDWKRISLEEREALLDSLRKADAARRASAPPPPPIPPGQTSCRPPFVTVDAADMEDFYPPVRAGQFKADREGNVWILPSTSTLSTPTSAGLVWDVVNRKGEIVERVKLPEGRNLAGFGDSGILYMIYAPSPGKILLERARIVRQ